jgi:hypothetical protein
MKKGLIVALSVLGLGIAASVSVAFLGQRTPVAFYSGHWHDEHGGTHNAPQHSGGTDKYGCHNASVPYHCH